ncbi:hypothetical protein LJ737_07420 [Hymenobacter sp. 15J16-1T3B]|uniref:hypothetical protein n=1 Tax=Hymenobacter sp. 15J16-1T3B TaxID=2886941 RepID=UPI001D0FA3F2|nr:hypothetical protein [Hymenobacter sp. 15J16-1T3B]MCC3157062.1 hypothetical protein [Hymenobacter sp. 15J16-1T3B]
MPALFSVLLFCLLSGLLAGCRRPSAAQHQFTAPPAAAAPTASRPQLVFLTFKAIASPSGPAVITLLGSTVAAGAPKSAPEDARHAPHYLTISQLGAQRQVLAAAAVEHPLRRSVETAGADGALQRQDVRLPEAEFFVRLALVPQATAVRVEEVVDRQPVGATDFPLPTRP